MKSAQQKRVAAARWATACVIGCACVAPAVAGPGAEARAQKQEMRAERQAQRAARQEAVREANQRQFDARAFEEQRRAAQPQQDAAAAQPQAEPPRDMFRRNGRLTPDERRDLRRQINEAGQDIYANRPRR